MIDQDKSKQQLIEELAEMRLQTEHWRSMVANTPAFVCLVDRAGTIQYLNRTVPGIAMEDAIGRSTYDFVEPAHWEIVRECIERVFDTGQPGSYEIISAGPNGTRSWYETSVGPIQVGGQVVAVTLIATDITQRKQAEEALAEREARLIEAQEVANLGFDVVDLASGRIATSIVLDRIFGIPADYERTLDRWVELLHLDDRQEMLDYLKEVVEQKKPFDREYRIVRYGDKLVRWVHGLGRLQFNEDGQPISILGTVQDITERKLAEATLRESEERFRQAMEATTDGLWDWNINSGDVYYSPAYSWMLGYDTAEFAERAESWTDHIHPDDRAKAVSVNQDCIENRIPNFEVEFRMRTKGGEWITILGRGKAVSRDANGRAIRMIGTHVDITGRKRSEEAVRASEAKFRSLFQDSPVGIAAVTPNGKFIQANQAFCEFLGYSDQELSGMTVSSVTHPEDRKTTAEAMQKALRSGSQIQRFDKRYLHKNGQVCWGELSSSLIFDANGNPSYFIAQVLDIGQQKQAEEARQASEVKYCRLHESMRDAFVSVGMDGSIQEFNDAYREMLGYEPEEFMKLCYTDLTPEKWHSYEAEIVQKQILTRGYSDIYEKEYRRKDGTVLPVELRTFLIKDDHDQPCAMWAIVRDITERKNAEEVLRKGRDELEQRVEERTAELEKANEKLQQLHDDLRTIYDSMVEGLLITDIETKRLIRVNPSLCRMLGYSEEELLAASIQDIHPTEEVPNDLQRFQAAAEGRVSINENRPVLRKDGSVFYADITGHRVFYDERPCLLALFRDITERKRAEEALQQSHEELRSIYNGMPDGLLAADIETKKFVRCNAAMGRMLGYTEVELLSRSVMDIHPADELPIVMKTFHALVEGRQQIGQDIPVLRRDGSVFHADVTHNEIELNGRRCTVGFFRDITERKRAEEALRQSEERYKLAARGAGVGLWDWNICTGKLYFSPRWKMMFGYDENDIGESLEDWARLLHPDERDRMLKFLGDFLAGTLPTVTVEYRLRHKDGSYRWIVAHAIAVRDEQGRACRLVGSHGDITDRKRAEDSLERERQSLWKMLQASDHERQIISYEIHDGLAQYLAAAGMQFQAYDYLKENMPVEAKKAYETAVELVRQAHAESRRLINEVRPPVIDEIGLETAISHLVHEQRKRGGPKIECHSDVQFRKLPSILENALYRITQEALTNACKHSKSRKVLVTLTQEGQDVRLEVRDWGIGFDAEAVREGHFGLEGIRQRVRLLGGRLTIESKLDSGTLVQAVVPIMEKPTED